MATNKFGTAGGPRQSMPADTGTMQEDAAKVHEGLGRVARGVRARAEGKMDQAAEAAQDLYNQARERAHEAQAAMREQAAGFERTIRQNVEARPLMTVAVALGVGWIIGRMMHS